MTEENVSESQQQTQQQEQSDYVPYDRFQAVTETLKQEQETLKQTKAALKELEKWKAEKEQADMTELEKARAQVEKAREAQQAAEQRATTAERTGWVIEAARQANFADPGDAAAFLSLSELEDAKAVEKAVKDLAEKKPHLLAQQGPGNFGSQSQGANSGDTDEVPVGKDGNPDYQYAIGRDLLAHIQGRRGR